MPCHVPNQHRLWTCHYCIAAVPKDSPDNQPLYGYGVEGLDAVYVRPDSELNETCYTAPNFYTSPSCGVSVCKGTDCHKDVALL
jgi:hypothetical protein